MSTDVSALVAKSAVHSLKRSRILYDVHPQAAFIPSVDPNIEAISIARRKRRIRPTIANNQVTSTSNALAVISESNTGVPSRSQAGTVNSSTALIQSQDTTAADESKPGGILVVSRSMEDTILKTQPLNVSDVHCSAFRRNPNRAPKSRSQHQPGMHRGN